MIIKNKQDKVLVINPGSTKVKRVVFCSDKFNGIGIRIVHGGGLKGPIKIDKEVEKVIRDSKIFAPIHNEVALEEIKNLKKEFPQKDIWAFFDTDFHQTIPEQQKVITIDQKIAKKYNLRNYGFHGIAVESVIRKIDIKKYKKIIAVHLGGGSSVTAIKNGRSIYNSMGLTPLSGLMGKTRSGNVDPDIFNILYQKGYEVSKISEMLSHHSGFQGLLKNTNTKKIIFKAHQEKSFKKEKTVYDIYLNQIAGEIGKAMVLLKGCDLITLSGGIGFNNEYIKNDLYQKIKVFNIFKKQIKQIKSEEEKLIFEKLIQKN